MEIKIAEVFVRMQTKAINCSVAMIVSFTVRQQLLIGAI
jgi:hypothetical protein